MHGKPARKNRSLAALILAAGLCLAFAAQAESFHIRPHLQNITPDGVTVIWESDDPGPGLVEYGAPGTLDKKAEAAGPEKIHRVRITGLEPDSEYAYRVKAGSEQQEAAFRTAPNTDRPITYVVVGDTRNWSDRWEATQMGDHTLQWKPEFYINSGDLVREGHKYENWPEHFNRFAPLTGGHMMVTSRANHEGSMKRDADNDWFAKYHDLPGGGEPFAVFDWGNTHFVLVSFEESEKAAAWLDEHMKTVNKRWVVVVQHFPIYCTGYRSPGDSRKEPGTELGNLAQTLDKYHVVLDIAGHTHIYERSYPLRESKRDTLHGTTYVVNGGGIKANYPDTWTAFADDPDSMAPPTYTLVKATDDRIDLKTFCWSPQEKKTIQIDHAILWQNESVPTAAVKALKGKKGGDQIAAIEELGAMMYEPAAKVLVPFLTDKDVAVRRAAATAMRSIGNTEVANEMLPLLNDSDAAVCREAARYFEIAMPAELAGKIGEQARDAKLDPAARASLVGALQMHAPNSEARDIAIALLDPKEPVEVRRRAAHAIGDVAEKSDVPAVLGRVENEPDEYTLLRMGFALNRLTSTRVAVDEKGALAKSKPGMRADIVKPWADTMKK